MKIQILKWIYRQLLQLNDRFREYAKLTFVVFTYILVFGDNLLFWNVLLLLFGLT